MENKFKITESSSLHRHLDKMPIESLLIAINQEDQKVPQAIAAAIPQIQRLVEALVDKMLAGGRLFYIGAGTSGRLGVVDASECPPTYGVDPGLVVGIIAGGRQAMFQAVEFAEDDPEQAWKDLQEYEIRSTDFVVGIAASGSTPYVVGGLARCKENGISTGCITCNPHAAVSKQADYPIEVVVGPEFVTGSTRMKSGTAQKLVLNMISTSAMIQLGRVEDNRMVNMQLTNEKLIDRGIRMVRDQLHIDDQLAKELLLKSGSVKKAVELYKGGYHA